MPWESGMTYTHGDTLFKIHETDINMRFLADKVIQTAKNAQFSHIF